MQRDGQLDDGQVGSEMAARPGDMSDQGLPDLGRETPQLLTAQIAEITRPSYRFQYAHDKVLLPAADTHP